MTTKQQRIEEEQHVWNGIALIVYIALCALSVWLIARYGTFDPNALSFLDLAVLGLAAFRLVHLITYDKIFDTVRAVFMDREGTRLKSAERGWRRLMCEFMQCIWCTGMWSGLIVVTVYYLGVWGRYAAIVLAVAGLGSLLQLLSKALAAKG
jgi:ABC-type sugar transport system permease subunit